MTFFLTFRDSVSYGDLSYPGFEATYLNFLCNDKRPCILLSPNIKLFVANHSNSIHGAHRIYDWMVLTLFLPWLRGTQRRFPPKYDEYTFQAIQSTFTSLEMHSKRRLKISVCSVILGELKSSKLQELQYFFSKNFRSNLTFYESENFSDNSLHHNLESENFRFPFSEKNSVTWAVL